MNEFGINTRVTVEVENSTLARITLTCVIIFILFFTVEKMFGS